MSFVSQTLEGYYGLPTKLFYSAPCDLYATDNAAGVTVTVFIQIKEDIGEFGSKRARMESPVALKSHTPSPTMSRDSDGSKKSEDSDLNDTAGLEMDFMDQLACVVCRCGKPGAIDKWPASGLW